jgi:AbiV family abortive infection protein
MIGLRIDNLLKGAWLARVQCGLLLRDAVALHEARGYASAVALALFAHEELGKSSMLLDFWTQARKTGGPPDSKAVICALKNHKEKQWHGMLTPPSDPDTDALIEMMMNLPDRPTPEQDAAWTCLYENMKATPPDRHRQRMRSLFVDWDYTAGRWQTPSEVSASTAHRYLRDAIRDYHRAWTNRSPSEEEAACAALQVIWPDLPLLPDPGQPTPPTAERRRP